MGRRTGVSPRLAKIFYLALLVMCMILATVLRFNSYAWDLGPLSVHCGNNSNTTTELTGGGGLAINQTVYCKGDQAVYRISFILCLFFSALLFLTLVSERVHRGFWGVKLLLLVGGIIGSFFMSDFNTFDYAWFARVASFGFLVLQILILIDFAYQWNESWVNRAYAGAATEYSPATDSKWLAMILVSALLLYGVCSVGGFAVLYLYYASCDVGVGLTTWTVVAVFGMTLLSLFREQLVGVPGAILPVGVVSAYVVFLCWGALESNSDVTCRPTGSSASSVWSIVLGCVWAIITLLWATYTVTGNAAHLVKAEPLQPPPETGGSEVKEKDDVEAATGAPRQLENTGGPVTRADHAAPVKQQPPVAAEEEDDDSEVRSPEAVWPFHLIMLCASAYLSMLLTDWGAYSDGEDGSSSVALTGDASMWAKFAAQLATVLLFTWTLIAPAVLRNRQF